ncbi:peptidase [Paraburkholderia ginsengiterrae]|uniref:Peptidase n=1 Tax=Paraburkholderia ginsengiterrae TaxID=1462993 RepID=A0A1A9NG75_9BURK|nr:DUF2325 domain-containing protein [Paraburkholderia ginsengiterrae]OAJ62220.1 peptidase [Paraburkholderia ginsengiterrae]OAJ65420.1 peptidase [Paraburkholderia ginsengiterrae]
MHTPPFRLAQPTRLKLSGDELASTGLRTADPCCTPSEASVPHTNRRARLAELDGHLHCSIIGTCLSTHELRRLLPKFTDLDRRDASDLEIHHSAVELASQGGTAAKALHKLLDERYAGAIRRFDNATDDVSLLALWDDALKSGDIPPAYWALMTHPFATMPVRQKAFGELHMLSHLVGAANRADIRRLVALEEENAALKEKLERQQSQMQELGMQRDASIAALNEQIAQFVTQTARQLHGNAADLQAEVLRLRDRLAEADQRVALHTTRREAAEQRALQEQQAALALRKHHDQTLRLLKLVQSECDALERATVDVANSAGEAGARRSSLARLQGKRIVYVGGRPGSNAALKRLVEASGGDLLVHDGGVEDRKGLLVGALPGADLVVFPVNCIDHDSMNTLKRVCERHQIDYHPLRTASVASFIELMSRLPAGHLTHTGNPPPSAFCLRHG